MHESTPKTLRQLCIENIAKSEVLKSIHNGHNGPTFFARVPLDFPNYPKDSLEDINAKVEECKAGFRWGYNS